jgi:hypothetical protein
MKIRFEHQKRNFSQKKYIWYLKNDKESDKICFRDRADQKSLTLKGEVSYILNKQTTYGGHQI